jgi:hypothetical protein
MYVKCIDGEAVSATRYGGGICGQVYGRVQLGCGVFQELAQDLTRVAMRLVMRG